MIAEIRNNDIFIDGNKIKDKIFSEEKSDYVLRDREQQIDDLISWISETKNFNDKYLMKTDLKFLMDIKDEVIFSSISTNEFIAKSVDKKRFDEICKEILLLNKTESD